MALESLSRARSGAAPSVSPTEKRCFNCDAGAGVGDFCEACGTWQHPGCCRFCYEDLDPGALFCHECGSDQSGITCTGCQERSFFDFCGRCFEPLTQRARLEIAQATTVAEPTIVPTGPTQAPEGGETEPSDSIDATAPPAAVQPPMVKSTGQQARARIMALRAQLTVTVREPTGWRCNRWNAVHQSPNACAAPEHGGEWLFD